MEQKHFTESVTKIVSDLKNKDCVFLLSSSTPNKTNLTMDVFELSSVEKYHFDKFWFCMK
jgi:hypothetical protein